MNIGLLTSSDRSREALHALHGELLSQGQRLEAEAATARNAGDYEGSHRLAGERDGRYHLAIALAELQDVALTLEGLRSLVDLARQQTWLCQAQVDRWRAKWGIESAPAQAYSGLLVYWQALGLAYHEAGEQLYSALKTDPEERSL